VAPLPERIQRGICVAHNYQASGRKGYGTKTSAKTLRELKALGAEWVSLTPFGFMRGLDEPEVHAIGDYRAGETDDRMRREIRQAKQLGLNVLLKPHLWIVDGKWRGAIAFDDEKAWHDWFDSYERWLLHYADMAEAEGVALFAIGVELRSTERALERRWRGLIRRTRKRFKGKLIYAANWDDVSNVDWWDALDYVGVQFYPPLTNELDAERSTIRSTLDERLDEIEAVSVRARRPVIFTEVGFRASKDALIRPHEWPDDPSRVPADAETQALGYRIFTEAIRSRPWVAGIYWWKWFTDPNTTEEGPTGFSPRGKPAEAVIRASYGGNCAAGGPSL
jgi:hypothetical protein